jgi:hypothetical protein
MSGADGTYRMEIGALATEFVGCARVGISSTTAAFASDSATVLAVTFREGILTDSTRLDFTVTPLP